MARHGVIRGRAIPTNEFVERCQCRRQLQDATAGRQEGPLSACVRCDLESEPLLQRRRAR
jgi:hypothetical protein